VTAPQRQERNNNGHPNASRCRPAAGQAAPSASACGRKAGIVSTPQLPGSAQPLAAPPSARPGNGLGVAALVLGVASLVAAVSFILFPLGLLGGLVAAVLGGIAVTRGRPKGATNPGQATAGIVCGVLGKRRDKPAWRRRWKSSTSKG
jgi:hypothetical protein